jgi:hypothetical protein
VFVSSPTDINIVEGPPSASGFTRWFMRRLPLGRPTDYLWPQLCQAVTVCSGRPRRLGTALYTESPVLCVTFQQPHCALLLTSAYNMRSGDMRIIGEKSIYVLAIPIPIQKTKTRYTNMQDDV